MEDQVRVIKRSSLPASPATPNGERERLERSVREIDLSEHLRQYVGEGQEAPLTWVRLGPGETLRPTEYATQVAIVVQAGAGEVFGDVQRRIGVGDVFGLPPKHRYRLTAGGEGMSAIVIQYGQRAYGPAERADLVLTSPHPALADLLVESQKRLEEFLQRPIVEILADRVEDDIQRKRCVQYLEHWRGLGRAVLRSDAARWMRAAGRRSLEEGSARDQSESDSSRDTILEAVTSWFEYQLQVLDEIDKAALVRLVVEPASTVLSGEGAEGVEDVRDAREMLVDEQIFGDQVPETHARLNLVVGQAWDMVEALCDRVVELTRAESPLSGHRDAVGR